MILGLLLGLLAGLIFCEATNGILFVLVSWLIIRDAFHVRKPALLIKIARGIGDSTATVVFCWVERIFFALILGLFVSSGVHPGSNSHNANDECTGGDNGKLHVDTG